MDIYEEGAIDLSEYKPESKGVIMAKRRILWRNIVLLYVAAAIILFLMWSINDQFGLQYRFLKPTGTMRICLAIVTVGLGAIAVINSHFSKVMINSCTLEEIFDHDLYLYHKRKIFKGVALVSLAIINAKMGDRQLCSKALAKLHHKTKSSTVEYLKEWVADENADLDVEKLPQIKRANPILVLTLYLLMAYDFMFTSVADYINFYYKVHSRPILLLMVLLSMLGAIMIFHIIRAYIIVANHDYRIILREKIDKKALRIKLLIPAIIVAIYLVADRSEAYLFALGLDDDSQTESTEDYYDYDSNDYSYDYEYESDSSDYSYDEEEGYLIEDSEPVGDLDIMNFMIVLCNYLKEEGTIPDFSVELDYSAKGRVKGTVAKDEDFVYVLYDNDIKEDENGNDCLELVLEAEPLDENGNSLGQTEAKLRGFYLVNIETKEVIDEHKTHW